MWWRRLAEESRRSFFPALLFPALIFGLATENFTRAPRNFFGKAETS